MSYEADLKALVKAAYRAYVQEAPLSQARAQRLLENPKSPATALLIATKRCLGLDAFGYEPETLWIEFKEVPPANRDKLLAAIGVATFPSFFWYARVFGNTALAFSNEAVFAAATPEPSPEAMAWAAFEGELIFSITEKESVTPTFDAEVAAYVAALLYHAGYVVPPEHLEFAGEALRALLHPAAKKLATEVKEAWSQSPKPVGSTDSAVGVQLARLAEARSYFSVQSDLLAVALEAL